MRKTLIIIFTSIVLIMTGCEEAAAPDNVQSSIQPAESSIPVITEYEPLITFEYTEQMLEEMNEDYTEFLIEHDEKGNTYIDGHINRSPVKNERDVMEQLKMIRSILGLTDPEKQIFYSPRQSGEDVYRFNQYHGGLRLYAGDVVVNTDTQTNMIEVVSSSITNADILETVKLDNILSEEDVIKMNPSAQIKEKVIWNVNEYNDAPVAAYVAVNEDEYIIISAENGKIIANWSFLVD